jgi:hypothetical protein
MWAFLNLALLEPISSSVEDEGANLKCYAGVWISFQDTGQTGVLVVQYFHLPSQNTTGPKYREGK